jgi:adenine-specific DNA-methyltransferase
MIYIDPPYNTGSDSFIYPDKFSETKEEYLRRIGEKDDEGFLMKQGFFRKNSKENGQFHSNWLNMMLPRLFLARNLLQDDGVIFVSIDDNEQANLKLLMDEIFGEENFVGQIIWQTATDNNATQIAVEHEYILCYAKSLFEQDVWEIPTEKGKYIQAKYEELLHKLGNTPEKIQMELRTWINSQKKNGMDLSGVSHYSYVDEIGVFYPGNSANTKPGGYNYDIIHPITNGVCAKPNYGYRFKKETFNNANDKGDVLWGKDETTIPKIKKRLDTATEKLKSYYYEDNRATTNNLALLFNGVKIFDNPKSVNLLKHLIKYIVDKEGIILDFFAGSGTIAEAVLELNEEYERNIRYIGVQLPELIDEKSEAYKVGYKTIAEITKARIEKVIEKIEKKRNSELELSKKQALGFRKYTLASSNFKIWRSDFIETEEDLVQQMQIFITPQKEGSTTENILWELLIKNGVSLTEKVNKLELSTGETIYHTHNKKLAFILDKYTLEVQKEALLLKPKTVICLDSLFEENDTLKTNARLQFEDNGITFKTI